MGNQRRKCIGGGQPRRTIIVTKGGGQPRKQIKWRPQWTGPYENYARHWVRKQYWRVRHVCPTRDDAISECALVYAKCVDRYINNSEQNAKEGYGVVNNHAWFMALFKQSIYYRWIRLQWNDEAMRSIESDTHVEDLLSNLTPTPYQNESGWRRSRELEASDVQYPDGVLNCAIQESTNAVQCVLARLLEAPQEVVSYLIGGSDSSVLSAPATRTKVNNALMRWCNIRTNEDIISAIKEIVGGD